MITLNHDDSIKAQFISDWFQNEWKEDEANYDLNAVNRMKLHLKEDSNFTYRLIQIEESDLDQIVLPHHIHEPVNISTSGMYLSEFIVKFTDKILNQECDNCCSERIRYLIKRFDQFPSELDFIKGNFMYLTDKSELGVKGHYSLPGIYAGSFHQFAAYGAWIHKNGFKPLVSYFLTEG